MALDEAVRRLDSVSKSVGVLRQARRIHPMLRSSRQALTHHEFTDLEIEASRFERPPVMAQHLHLPAIGK
jgi:hypothetical protein